jgi:hypothetical protein
LVLPNEVASEREDRHQKNGKQLERGIDVSENLLDQAVVVDLLFAHGQ